jgi:hypothetical protein
VIDYLPNVTRIFIPQPYNSWILTKAVFGWAVAFEKTAAVGCELWKSSCEKAVVGKAEDRLVRGVVKLQAV